MEIYPCTIKIIVTQNIILHLKGVVNTKRWIVGIYLRYERMERKGKNNNDYVSRRIFELMSHRGIKDSELERKIGLGRGMVSHWRHDRRNTYLQYINEICDCLNTTPNYLFRGTEQQEPSFVLSPIEKDLILMYRTFDEKMKKYIKDGFELLTKMKLY